MRAQPALAGHEEFNSLIEDLNDFVGQPPSDEFSREKVVRALTMRAQRLREVNQGLGFSALGSIAAARGDERNVHHYHRLSLDYLKGSLPYSNYAGSLMLLGQLSSAYDYAFKGLELEPNDKFTLRLSVELSDLLDKDDEYREYLATYEHHYGKCPYSEVRANVEDTAITWMCMLASESALSKIWDNPEEDAAWASL